MNFFSKSRLSDLINTKKAEVFNRIENESEKYILKVDQESYIDHLVSEFELDFPTIEFDSVTADSTERYISASRHPRTYDVSPGEKYKRRIIQYYIPTNGNISFLGFRPSSIRINALSGGLRYSAKDQALVFEYILLQESDIERIKQDFKRDVDIFEANYNYLKEECERFNTDLPDFIRSTLEKRKNSLLKTHETISIKLGVPLREKAERADSISIPISKKKKIKLRPIVRTDGIKIDPHLSDVDFNKTLSLIHEAGSFLEQHVDTYRSMGENAWRDIILLALQTNTENVSATAETFNRGGRTDILIKHKGNNLFVAECKIWKGQKALHNTIDQLISYCTWKDTKTAILFFVDQSSLTTILKTIPDEIKAHNNYIDLIDRPNENWFNFQFYIDDNRERLISLSILLFHIPKKVTPA